MRQLFENEMKIQGFSDNRINNLPTLKILGSIESGFIVILSEVNVELGKGEGGGRGWVPQSQHQEKKLSWWDLAVTEKVGPYEMKGYSQEYPRGHPHRWLVLELKVSSYSSHVRVDAGDSLSVRLGLMAKGKGDEVCEIENMSLPYAPRKYASGNLRNGWRISVVALEEVQKRKLIVVVGGGRNGVRWLKGRCYRLKSVVHMACGHARVSPPCVPHSRIAQLCADSIASLTPVFSTIWDTPMALSRVVCTAVSHGRGYLSQPVCHLVLGKMQVYGAVAPLPYLQNPYVPHCPGCQPR
ncbi:hypothetical protein GOBAR_AA11972 [Gossypium barbadense]|uniref:Uncharacterized protein n=1 Tax=Gossypium barbadense TaxID=3634 RepID=A0A2P5XZA2_GOSBA|nr:hypothetical protein GOBAR_AA11972 [Gossypium barbadense]